MLHQGQVVRYGTTLYRVDYVNECRARIVPLAKRHVVLDDGREFDAVERGGLNISPNSPLEVVDDVERAKTEMELAKAERELRQLQAEQASIEKAKLELVETERELAALKAERAALPPPKPRAAAAGGGWRIVGALPETKPGSLKANVLAFLQAHPGAQTREVAIPGATTGAVAACLDRFMKAGVIARTGA